MGTIAKAVVVLEAQSAAFTRGTSAAGADADKLAGHARKAAKDVGGLRGALDSLKSGAGRGSTLDELGKTIRGAGAVAGITLMGEALNHASEKAAELSQQFRKGEIDATGMGVKIAESLPIIGSFVSAGQNIREMFTHEKEEIDAINKTAELGNGIMEARVKLVHDVANELRELGRAAAESQAKVIESTLPPEARRRFEVDLTFGNKQDDLKHKIEEQLKGVDDAVKAQRAKIAPELLAMTTQLQHATAGSSEYKTLANNVAQLRGSMAALTDTAKKQKDAIAAAAAVASHWLSQEQDAADREPASTTLRNFRNTLPNWTPTRSQRFGRN